MPAFLTTSGLQKFAVATPENPVTVKYMAIGTGFGTVSENIQGLFNEVYRTEIPNPLRDEDNPRNLEFTGYIPTTVGGWTITELGLYDSSGVLVAYHLLDESIVKSSPDSALKTDMYPTFILALSNAEDVNLFVSDSVEFDHEALTGRGKMDSHPISAITDLQLELDEKTLDLRASELALNNSINLDRNTKRVTSSYAVLNTDGGMLEIDASAGNMTITMPKSTAFIAKEITLHRTDSTANIVTIVGAAGDIYRGEGATWTSMSIVPSEVITFKAGNNIFSGMRGNIISLYRNGTELSIVEKGVVGGNVLLKDGDSSALSSATTSKKGVVQIGSNLSINAAGVLSGPSPYSLPMASSSTLGGVRVGSNIGVNSGVISVAEGSSTQKGVVQAGGNVTINSGVVSVADSSTSQKGVVQLSDSLSNYSSSQALTANQGAILNGMMLGWGQTPQNVSSSRTAGVTYTNSTGRPIAISIGLAAGSVRRSASLFVADVFIGSIGNEEQHDTAKSISFIIPSGATYRVDGVFTTWVELR